MTNIIDHVGFSVSDFEKAKAFYLALFAPLGITLLADFTHDGNQHAGFGTDRPTFWIGTGKSVPSGVHVAFAASTRAAVDAFYAAGLANGGTDNGAPGLRAHYHPDYYGAFVIDPDGNNVEAVCHGPA